MSEPDHVELTNDEKVLVAKGLLTDAANVYQLRTDCDIDEARRVVDAYSATGPTATPAASTATPTASEPATTKRRFSWITCLGGTFLLGAFALLIVGGALKFLFSSDDGSEYKELKNIVVEGSAARADLRYHATKLNLLSSVTVWDVHLERIAKDVWKVAGENPDATTLTITVRSSGLVDKYGNRLGDNAELGTMEVGLMEVRKYVSASAYASQPEAKRSYGATIRQLVPIRK